MGLLCLDLDGTLVESALIEQDGKLQRPQQNVYHEPVLLPGRLEVIQRAASEGDCFAIITNQGGVAWGYHTVAEVNQRIGRALELLHFFAGQPFVVQVAFAHPRASIPAFRGESRRKPGPEMIFAAMASLGAGPQETLMVGDLPEDEQAAHAAGVDFALAGDFFAS